MRRGRYTKIIVITRVILFVFNTNYSYLLVSTTTKIDTYVPMTERTARSPLTTRLTHSLEVLLYRETVEGFAEESVVLEQCLKVLVDNLPCWKTPGISTD